MSASSQFVVMADLEFFKSGFGLSCINAGGKSVCLSDKLQNATKTPEPPAPTIDSKQKDVK